jgi:hypothetical protein
MRHLEFSWDEIKARKNLIKHGVSFDEAVSIFYDEKAIEFYDPDHSEDEDRFLIVGMSVRLRNIVVCHCLRNKGTIIRIISARKATKHETRFYAKGEIL